MLPAQLRSSTKVLAHADDGVSAFESTLSNTRYHENLYQESWQWFRILQTVLNPLYLQLDGVESNDFVVPARNFRG